METKTCTKCKETKTLDGFHTDKKGKFGKHSKCKICRNIQCSEIQKFSKYGITPEKHQEMRDFSNNTCYVCKKPGSDAWNKSLCIDHCHTTGKVRGLLCNPCNVALGCVTDCPERLQGLIDYLANS